VSSRLGLELGPHTIRAVRFFGPTRSQVRTLEVAWDPENPKEAVAALRDHLGPARQVFAAIDLSLLRVKRISLPPVPLEEKRRILGLEPDRFFAVRGEEMVFALQAEGDLVYAAAETLVAAWIDALAGLGPLERLEPAPVALARVAAKADAGDGIVLQAVADGAAMALRLSEGQVAWVRRLRGDATEALLRLEEEDQTTLDGPVYVAPWSEETEHALAERFEGLEVRPLPSIADVDAAYLTAYGAGLATEAGWRESLLTAELERTLTLRRRTRLALAAVACTAAFAFAVLSLEASRERAERRLDERIAALQERASSALLLQQRAEALDRQAAAVLEIENTRPNPLEGLLELSEEFPADAWLRSIRSAGGEVQIDGYARDAAALIPLFENDPRFEDVRFLSGTSRTQFGNETYENFSLALRAVRAP
jgi:Tfp pilus assembly protein PilN